MPSDKDTSNKKNKRQLTAAQRKRAETDRRLARQRMKAEKNQAEQRKLASKTGTSISGGSGEAVGAGGSREFRRQTQGKSKPFLTTLAENRFQGPAARNRPSSFFGNVGSDLSAMKRKLGGGPFANIFGRPAAGGMAGAVEGIGNNISDSLQSIIDAVAGAAGGGGGGAPTPPSYTPSLVDIDATLAPFGTAREQLMKQYATNQGEIGRLGGVARQDADMVAQGKLERLEAMRRLNDKVLQDQTSQITDDGGRGLTDLAAQGIDPAALQAELEAATGAAQRGSQGAQNLVADQSTQAKLAQSRAAEDARASERTANVNLDQNLFAAMADLAAQEQAARLQAEQFNAQAQRDAQQQNYQNQMAGWEANQAASADLSGLPSALQTAAADMDAFEAPYQGEVIKHIRDNFNMREGGIGHDMMEILTTVDNPDDAWQSLNNAIDAINEARVDSGADPLSPDMNNLRQLLNRYYHRDTNRLSADKGGALRQLFLQQARGM